MPIKAQRIHRKEDGKNISGDRTQRRENKRERERESQKRQKDKRKTNRGEETEDRRRTPATSIHTILHTKL
jgi:hypothetical protein